ncbi:MAG: protein kinase [Candidatus Competibacteraceae bacterium]|nr:protein kinase [Candidatus Competibacteraceae bacterium]
MTTTPSSTASKSSGRRANALPVGCMLDEYRIDSILGAGGFGVTYKALDTHLDAWVAIKEYFPVEWSFRDPDGLTVHPNTQGDASGSNGELSDYRWGLERFLDEARVLARIQHPYVVRVKRYFRAHGTAYIVMDYEEGQPLSMILREEEKLREDEVRGLLEDVLPALCAVHEQGYLHRDIKPSNLYVRASDHRVILIDFGAARQAVGRHSQSVTSLVTPGYSPPEQYTTRNDRYGAWTDIYALGAVLYRCITGHTPTDAADRLLDDSLEPAVKVGAGRYSTNLLRVIDRMLAVRPDQRFSTVVEAQAALAGAQDDDSDETVIMLPIKTAMPAPMFETSRITHRPAKPAVEPTRPEAQQTAHLPPKPPLEPLEPDHSEWLQFTQPSARAPSAKQQQKPPKGSASQWRLIAFVGGGVALVAVAVLLIWLGLSEPTPQPTVESKPPPRYHLGQQEPVVADSPTPPEAPASTPAPPGPSPTTPDGVGDTPTPVENTEMTSTLIPPAKPAVGSESEPTTVESAQETVDSPDLPIEADGASQPAVAERAPEITGAPEPPATQDGAESASAEKEPETTGVDASTTGVTGIPVSIPGTVPANITPKADTSTEPANRRAVTEEPKTPRKTQRTQQPVKKKTRPWKVIPYDPSAKKPAQADSTRATPRANYWSDPGNSGFNQK